MNLNKVFLIGRLTADPQLRTTTNGNQVATFSIATNRVWNDKIAGRREDTEFHNLVVWGKQADIVSRFLTKGSSVFIEGRLQTRTWQDKQGQNRKTTEIIGERIQLGPRPSGSSTFSNQRPASSALPSNAGWPASAPINQQSEVPTIDISEEPAVNESFIEGEIKKEDLPF